MRLLWLLLLSCIVGRRRAIRFGLDIRSRLNS